MHLELLSVICAISLAVSLVLSIQSWKFEVPRIVCWNKAKFDSKSVHFDFHYKANRIYLTCNYLLFVASADKGRNIFMCQCFIVRAFGFLQAIRSSQGQYRRDNYGLILLVYLSIYVGLQHKEQLEWLVNISHSFLHSIELHYNNNYKLDCGLLQPEEANMQLSIKGQVLN